MDLEPTIYNKSYYLSNSSEKQEPFRLTFIKCIDNCQFCENPQGGIYCHYISIEHRHGFISCEKCQEEAKNTVAEWFENKAYGDANYLRGRKIKVRRSSGKIETDWTLDINNPFIEEIDGYMTVKCLNPDSTIEKFCLISELLELNEKV